MNDRTPATHRGRATATALLMLAAALAPRAAIGQDMPPAQVHVGRVVIETVQQRRLVTGDVRAARHSEVATHESGIVEKFPIREGDLVESGAVLASLDADRLRLQLDQLAADLQVFEASSREREAQVERARRNAESLRRAFDDDAANDRELQDAQDDLAAAVARLGQVTSQIASTAARQALLERRIADTEVRAPFAGVVIERRTELGEWLGEGDAVALLVALDVVEVWLDVPERMLPAVRRSAEAIAIDVEATERDLASDDYRIIPDVDPKARNFTLIATVPNDDRALAPGMSALAWVPTGTRADELTVPKNAVLRNEMGAYVFAVQGGEGGPASALQVPVEILFPLGDRFAVRTPGLLDGMLVVVEGNERLFPMAPIAPILETGTGEAPSASVRP